MKPTIRSALVALLVLVSLTFTFSIKNIFSKPPTHSSPRLVLLKFHAAHLVMIPKTERQIEQYIKSASESGRNVDRTESFFSPSLQLVAAHIAFTQCEDWNSRQLKPHLFHLRHNSWRDFFWEVDTKLKKVSLVSKGIFGSTTHNATSIDGISVVVFGEGTDKRPYYYSLLMEGAYLAYDLDTDSCKVIFRDMLIAGSDNFKTKEVKPGLLHIAPKLWGSGSTFLQVNTEDKEVLEINGGTFGSHEHRGNSLSITVDTTNAIASKEQGGRTGIATSQKKSAPPTLFATSTPRITADIEMNRLTTKDYPKSDWLESQKALYQNILKRNSYDILVVPFQVQGYAIDRVGRSLMTRYLSDRIQRSTGLIVPDPTLVARALGENSRTYDDFELFKLANELKVNTVVRGYVGHDRNFKMNFTILVNQRAADNQLKSDSDVAQVFFENLSFSHEHPPSEVFLGYLGQIVSKLFPGGTKKPTMRKYRKLRDLTVPTDVLAMVNKAVVAPIASSNYLQFLGSLFPGDSTAKEHLFERSLVALTEVSPESSDYPLLKARALFYLHRRPAAVEALGNPDSPQGKAFLAFLNGSLPELEKHTKQIKSPLLKLLSQIELNDLRFLYLKHLSGPDTYANITAPFPEWKMILTRRLTGIDIWNTQSNLEIKYELDKAFPLPGYTAETLARSRIVLGKSPLVGDDIEFSVYRHCRMLLEKSDQQFTTADGSTQPIKRDYLDLLYAISEFNILQDIRVEVLARGSYESALKLIDHYGMVYQGHPEMAYLRAVALEYQARDKDGMVRQNLLKESGKSREYAVYWSQGQFPHSYNNNKISQPYDNDFPQRPFWNAKSDEPTLEVSVLYTHYNFYLLQYLHGLYLSSGKKEAAEELIKSNRHRFVGNPDRYIYLAELERKGDDITGAIKLYDEAIEIIPDVWEPYFELGKLHLLNGDLQRAADTFSKYPLFHEEKPRDTVALSNYAFQAGNELWYRGAVGEATPFFNMSASYQTGSGAEMLSSATISLLDENYLEASYHYLRLIRRYRDENGYLGYMTLLHLLGYHKESWSLFDSLSLQQLSPYMVWPAFIGHRMQETPDDDLFQWITQREALLKYKDIDVFLAMNHLIDRPPDKELSKLIQQLALKTKSMDLSRQAALCTLADGYYALRTGNFLGAYETFTKRHTNPYSNPYTYERSSLKPVVSENRYYDPFKNSPLIYQSAIQYVVLSGVKAQKMTEVENILKEYEKKHGKDFNYYLSRAFISCSLNKHQQAINNLNSAWCRIPGTKNRPFFSWYQLVETSEWLYKDTGKDEYRNLALEWSKKYQRIAPAYAWAYAIEAKYTTSTLDRQRALAIALYLDKRSDRLSTFSEKEKEMALKWLGHHNPFLRDIKQRST